MKKLFFILFCGFLFTATSINAQVIDYGTTGELTWTLSGSSEHYTLTISGVGEMPNYDFVHNGNLPLSTTAPWSGYATSIRYVHIGYGVTSIGNCAFAELHNLTSANIPNSVTFIGEFAFARTALTSITIPNGVTSIEDSTFNGCRNLTSVNIPNNVRTIGSFAFVGTALTSITIPNSVTSIGIGAFQICENLTSVTLGNGVTTIETGAFNHTGFASITIPRSVTTIAGGAFSNIRNLVSIDVDVNNPHFASENGVLFNKSKTRLVQYPIGRKDKVYTIPNSVTVIASYAFSGSILTSVTIPNSVTIIGSSAFSSCRNLTSVTIGNSVTAIGHSAFSFSGLTSITIPNSVTTIDIGAFQMCEDLTSVIIGNSVETIGYRAFQRTNLTSITIPNSVRHIGNCVFAHTGLTSMILFHTIPPRNFGNFFCDETSSACIYVLDASLEAFRTAEGWRDLPCILPISQMGR